MKASLRFRGAHATRVPNLATRQIVRADDGLLPTPESLTREEVRGESPQTARESRALPG